MVSAKHVLVHGGSPVCPVGQSQLSVQFSGGLGISPSCPKGLSLFIEAALRPELPNSEALTTPLT